MQLHLNPGQLGMKHELYRCAMPFPLVTRNYLFELQIIFYWEAMVKRIEFWLAE